eukprot:Mrub_02545.p1 GENE.Mrub_02545~~Mrub_02545.p1  ORF type:complete len:514 (+),score=167.39 Mrub_02545:152-1543(+)
MQQQVYLLENENKLLKDREGEREKLMGLELSDGQPLNEHMVQLKLKYERCKMDLENDIKTKQSIESELKSSIKALNLDITKSTENCKQLQKKAEKTQERIDEDNKNYRERYDEISNEINRCSKTNKQAMNDLMDTKNEISEMLNKKREIDRKIEDENKKFREIESELIKKITELNKNIAQAQEQKQSLEIDLFDSISMKKITDRSRGLDIKLQEMRGTVDTLKSGVDKTEKTIYTLEQTLEDNYKNVAKRECQIGNVVAEIQELSDVAYIENLKERVEKYEKIQINKLKIETEQEQEKSNEYFENIKRIETMTNAHRNTYIKECNEKDELKHQYSKLDEQYKKQATEIARLMHDCMEKELVLRELSDKEEVMERDVKELVEKENKNKTKIHKIKEEINLLVEKRNHYGRFKNIEFEEIASIYNNNMKLSTYISEFNERFATSKCYENASPNKTQVDMSQFSLK